MEVDFDPLDLVEERKRRHIVCIFGGSGTRFSQQKNQKQMEDQQKQMATKAQINSNMTSYPETEDDEIVNSDD